MPIWRGTTSTDWGTASNWDTGVVPTTLTDAIFDATSTNPCTTGSVAGNGRQCRDLITTGFTNVLTVGTATNLGYIQVSRNITLGNSAGHLAGLSYIGIVGTTCTLDVATGFTVPYLSFGSISGTGGTCTVTLFRSFAVNKILKTGVGGTTATVTAGSTMTMDLTSGSISGASLTMAANVTLTINGSCSVSAAYTHGGNMTLIAGSTLTLLATLTLNASTLNFSAGTFTPGLQNVNINNVTVSINMGATNSFYDLGGGAGLGLTITMLSTLRITNNFSPSGLCSANGAFDIIVGGNIGIGTGSITNSTAGRKLTLTGASTGVSTIASWNSSNIQLEIDCVTRGFALTGTLGVGSLNYLPTNTGSFTTTGSTINYNNNLSINMNNSTNSWNILNSTSGLGPTLTLLSDVYCNTLGTVGSGDKINGPGFYVVTTGSTGTISNVTGTGSIKFIGSSDATWNQTAATTNALASIVFAKTAPAAVIIPNSFSYTGTLLKWDSGAVTHSGTLTLGAATTVNTTSAVSWNNIIIPASATITISSQFLITNSLLLSGTTTFVGAYGFTCGNLSCTVAASIITLQNITANPSAEYIVNGVLTLLGTLASRITLQAAGSATFNGTITPVGQLNYISGTIPAIGMTVSQSTGVSPAGLIGLLPSRPVITGGASPTFTISPSATAVIGVSFSMRAGYKAKFTLTNGTGSQNVAYVTTNDIDSNAGATITSFGSNGDDTTTNTALYRTLNWGPLIAPSGSVYYTFVN